MNDLRTLIDRLFPDGHDVAVDGDFVRGTGVVGGDAVAVVGTTNDAAIGVELALAMATAVLATVRDHPGRAIVLLVDTQGQRLRHRDELLGINVYMAHLAQCIEVARRAGHRIVSLVYGRAVSGGYITGGMMADACFALASAEISVMNLPAMARVTKIPRSPSRGAVAVVAGVRAGRIELRRDGRHRQRLVRRSRPRAGRCADGHRAGRRRAVGPASRRRRRARRSHDGPPTSRDACAPMRSTDVRRHDRVWLDAATWRAHRRAPLGADASRALDDWIGRGRALVVRRRDPDAAADGCCAAIVTPLASGRARIAVVVAFDAVVRVAPPLRLEDVAESAPADRRDALAALASDAARLGTPLAVFGSYAWQTIATEPYVTPSSDVDLLWDARDAVHAATVVGLLRRWEATHGWRLDGEARLADGACVAWRELDAAASRVLVKRDDRVALEPRPWSGAGAVA